MIVETYRSKDYAPDRVTGRYVSKRAVLPAFWTVYETATGTGRFAGKPGHGPTLREWQTDGEGLPESARPTWKDGTVQWPL